MPTYLVEPTSGGASFEIVAEHYTFDQATRMHTFCNGEGDSKELVATQQNVNVRALPST
jgi:hypothetical protein